MDAALALDHVHDSALGIFVHSHRGRMALDVIDTSASGPGLGGSAGTEGGVSGAM